MTHDCHLGALGIATRLGSWGEGILHHKAAGSGLVQEERTWKESQRAKQGLAWRMVSSPDELTDRAVVDHITGVQKQAVAAACTHMASLFVCQHTGES